MFILIFQQHNIRIIVHLGARNEVCAMSLHRNLWTVSIAQGPELGRILYLRFGIVTM